MRVLRLGLACVLLSVGCAKPAPPALVDRDLALHMYERRRAAVDRFERSSRRTLASSVPQSPAEREVDRWGRERLMMCGCSEPARPEPPSERSSGIPAPGSIDWSAPSRVPPWLRRVRVEVSAAARAAGARGVILSVPATDGAPLHWVEDGAWPQKRLRTLREPGAIDVGAGRAIGWGHYEVRGEEPLVAGLDVYLVIRVAGWDVGVRLMFDVQEELDAR